jgi:hypothetical protein
MRKIIHEAAQKAGMMNNVRKRPHRSLWLPQETLAIKKQIREYHKNASQYHLSCAAHGDNTSSEPENSEQQECIPTLRSWLYQHPRIFWSIYKQHSNSVDALLPTPTWKHYYQQKFSAPPSQEPNNHQNPHTTTGPAPNSHPTHPVSAEQPPPNPTPQPHTQPIPAPQPLLTGSQTSPLTEPITLEEVQAVSKKMGTAKARGDDDMPSELLTHAGPKFHAFLAAMFTAILALGYLPSSAGLKDTVSDRNKESIHPAA